MERLIPSSEQLQKHTAAISFYATARAQSHSLHHCLQCPALLLQQKLTQIERTLNGLLEATLRSYIHRATDTRARSQQWSNQEKGNPLHHKIHLPETIWKLTLQDIKFTAYFLKKYQQERLTSFLGFDPEDPQTSFPGSTQFRGRLK